MRKTHSAALALAGLLTACDKSPTSPTEPPPPAPTGLPRTLTGIVLESGTHAPVPDAHVCMVSGYLEGRWVENCATTKQDGSYRLDIDSSVDDCPSVNRQGFESLTDHLAVGENLWSPRIQRMVRVEAGQTVASTLFPDDASGYGCLDDSYGYNDYCTSCKRIRIVATRNGKLALRFTPENSGLRLALVNRELPTEPFPVRAGEEVQVRIMVTRQISLSSSFELSTALITE